MSGICVPRAWHSQDTQQRRRIGLLRGAVPPPTPEGTGGSSVGLRVPGEDLSSTWTGQG